MIGVTIHELLHSLGLHHEQNRHDRDDYVTVIWDNIKEGSTHNFEKKSATDFPTFGTKYDYLSIMHYGLNVSNSHGCISH